MDKERGFLFPKLELYIALINSKSFLNDSDSRFVCHPSEYTPAEMHELVEQDRIIVPCIMRFLKATAELLAEYVL